MRERNFTLMSLWPLPEMTRYAHLKYILKYDSPREKTLYCDSSTHNYNPLNIKGNINTVW